jgi:CO/xanthine dehydrogenase FAD-binding subunit
MNFNIISPENSEELLDAITLNQGHKFRFGAGYSDLLLEIKKQPDGELTIINLARLKDELFSSIKENPAEISIGALVTANKIIFDEEVQKQFPVLHSATMQLGSRQIRYVATVGGNLCTASPAGDIACALVALEAQCEILSAKGAARIIPIADFFLEVRKTDLKRDEILCRVLVPKNIKGGKIYSGFIKVGTRRSMEIAVVSLAFHLQMDDEDIINKAGVAIGSVAPTIRFARSACEYLTGRNFNKIDESNVAKFADKVLESASPISDIRASAWYRQEVLYNICRSIFEK